MTDDNRIIVEAWNTVLFDKFVRFRALLTDGLRGHSDACFAHDPVREGARVLDVGCGFGDTTLELARAVGDAGHATGVDCAANFIREAEAGARAQAVTNASFITADVQLDPLPGPYDHVFSRFGTMFFNLPGAALRNVRKALVPGGTLQMIVWRRREDNPWLFAAESCVRQLVPVIAHDDTNQVHCGPGPFSMSGADTVSDLLRSAGYTRIAFERCDLEVCIGRDLDEAVEFAMALGPAGEILRLAGAEGEKRKPTVMAALRDTLAQFAGRNGIWAPSSTWLISAQNAN
jgi:ubiquinone/menaquinone biosynthesis C-methylase UbiE